MTLPQSLRKPNWRTTSELGIPLHSMPEKSRAKDRTWAKIVAVKRKHSNKCEICGCDPNPFNVATGPLHGHHRLPRSAGGPSIVENCLLLCNTCHIEKVHGHPTEAYRNGWLIQAGLTPRAAPAGDCGATGGRCPVKLNGKDSNVSSHEVQGSGHHHRRLCRSSGDRYSRRSRQARGECPGDGASASQGSLSGDESRDAGIRGLDQRAGARGPCGSPGRLICHRRHIRHFTTCHHPCELKGRPIAPVAFGSFHSLLNWVRPPMERGLKSRCVCRRRRIGGGR